MGHRHDSVIARNLSLSWLAGLAVLLATAAVSGDDKPSPVRAAVERALPPILAGSRGSTRERRCFTCHNQGMPLLVFVEAREQGFDVPREEIDSLVDHTVRHLARGESHYLEARGQGGKADTAGMALWAMRDAGHEPTDLTDAVVHFLLEWQKDSPHWSPQSDRPPSEGSLFTSTFLALLGLDAYGRDAHRDRVATRRKAALEWLRATRPEETEDAVFRLWALYHLDEEAETIASAAEDLRKLQRADGGWAQKPDLETEAYSTGSALVVLHESGQVEPDSPAWEKGIRFLLESQLEDGTWHVESRSRPIQEHYESGFPHGEDQFLSSTATCWAALALLREIR